VVIGALQQEEAAAFKAHDGCIGTYKSFLSYSLFASLLFYYDFSPKWLKRVASNLNQKELDMTQSAFHSSARVLLESQDFDQNYRYVKKLIQELKVENQESLKRDIFGADERKRTLTKKEMQDLARSLRRIELQYAECAKPPIPKELESSIRRRNDTDWLPWELEAIEKVDVWREELQSKREKIRQMLDRALRKIRG